MFATFEAGINRDDIASMKLFLDMFGGCGVKVALVISHADKHGEPWRDSLKDQIMRHGELSQMITEEKMEIYFIGCVDVHDKQFSDPEDLEEAYKDVYTMRADILTFIFGAKEKKMLNEMNVTRVKISDVAKRMDAVQARYKHFSTCTDWNGSQIMEQVILHKEDIRYLSENSSYMNFAELSSKFLELLQTAEAFKQVLGISEEKKNELLWPLNLRFPILRTDTTSVV